VVLLYSSECECASVDPCPRGLRKFLRNPKVYPMHAGRLLFVRNCGHCQQRLPHARGVLRQFWRKTTQELKNTCANFCGRVDHPPGNDIYENFIQNRGLDIDTTIFILYTLVYIQGVVIYGGKKMSTKRPKPLRDTRSTVLITRITPKQKEEVARVSNERNLTDSDFIRCALRHAVVALENNELTEERFKSYGKTS
jgi:hypothetical protein